MEVQLGYFTSAFQTAFALNALISFIQQTRAEKMRSIDELADEIASEYAESAREQKLSEKVLLAKSASRELIDRTCARSSVFLHLICGISLLALLYVSFRGDDKWSILPMLVLVGFLYTIPLATCTYVYIKIWLHEHKTLDQMRDMALRLEARGAHKNRDISLLRAKRYSVVGVKEGGPSIRDRIVAWFTGHTIVDVTFGGEDFEAVERIAKMTGENHTETVRSALTNMFLLYEGYQENPEAELVVYGSDGTEKKRVKIIDILQGKADLKTDEQPAGPSKA